MRRWLEGLEQFAIDVILERRYGRRAELLRWILLIFSGVYCFIVQCRLKLYRDRYFHQRALGCPVISVGNLTVGGTGKTPVVEMLARELLKGGRKVAILTRGYKSVAKPLTSRIIDKIFRNKGVFLPRIVSDGQSLLLDSRRAGDEPFMLANNLKGVPVLVDKDRAKSGLFAIQHFGADTLLLDDGLQYLRLQHRIDIVLIDCQSPFGNEYLLPRGTLREPCHNLQRANYIFITKSTTTGNAALIERIRTYNKTAEIIECAHRSKYLRNIVTGEIHPLEFLQGKTIASICGIAVPESFENALRHLGAEIEIAKSYTDHHRFSNKEIENFIRRCGRRNIPAILTTEKDAVRFPRIIEPEVPIYFLRVEIEILSGHTSWERLLTQVCNPDALLKSPAHDRCFLPGRLISA
ncbi:MAG: tetraacyldisaccharide 4'-kinase [Chthoniobacterales bacterium]